jgi:hypothetical protein
LSNSDSRYTRGQGDALPGVSDVYTMLLKYLVKDEFGEPLRKFYTLESAKWFIELRPGCTIEQVAKDKRVTFTDKLNEYGEAPF